MEFTFANQEISEASGIATVTVTRLSGSYASFDFIVLPEQSSAAQDEDYFYSGASTVVLDDATKELEVQLGNTGFFHVEARTIVCKLSNAQAGTTLGAVVTHTITLTDDGDGGCLSPAVSPLAPLPGVPPHSRAPASLQPTLPLAPKASSSRRAVSAR